LYRMATKASDVLTYFKAHKLAFLYANLDGKSDGVSWMFEHEDFPGQITAESLIGDFDIDQGMIKGLEKQCVALEILRKKLEIFPEKEGYARVAIRKIRGKDKRVEGYSVLAIFPESTLLTHYGLDENATGAHGGNQAVFYEPIAACYENACSELYNITPEGENRGMFYLPLKEVHEAQKGLIFDASGVAHYVIGVDKKGNKITQDRYDYLTAGLLGGVIGETKRIRISDLWKRIGVKF